MKKVLSIMIIVALILSVSACSKPEPAPAPAPEVEQKAEQPEEVIEYFTPNFDTVQSAKMGAFMGYGFYLMTDENFYACYSDYFHWVKDHKVSEDGTITVTPKNEQTPNNISELASSTYLCEGPDDAIYLINSDKAIVKLPVGSIEYEVISEPGVNYLSTANDKLYYTRGDDYRFYSSNLDGSEEELIIDKEAYYTYVIEDHVIYQDDNDNESIYLYNMETGEDTKLLEGPAYSPNIIGNYLYCSLDDKETGFSKLVGGEFKQDTGFEPFAEEVLNPDNSGWFSDLNGLGYAINEDAAFLYFYGQYVRYFGEPDQIIVDNEGIDMWATIPAYHFFEEYLNFGSAGFHSRYSSPYGMVYHTFGNHEVRIEYFSEYTNFENGLYRPGTNVENVVNELKEKAGA